MRNRNLTLSLLAVTFSVMAMQACGGFNSLETGLDSTGSVMPSSTTANFKTLKASIFDQKCVSCHSTEFSSYTSLLASGMVMSGQPSQSPLYLQTSAGSMPQGGPRLSSTDIANIQAFILMGLPSGDVSPTPVPSSSATPTPTPTPSPTPATMDNGTFTYLEANLFQKSCVGCHNSNSAAGGYDLTSYTGAHVELVPGNPSQSTLYMQVKNGSMPPGGPKVSDALALDLYNWILNGAENN